MAARMKVKLVQAGAAKFVASNAAGATGVIDGPPDMGGENAGLRPMETLLAAMAGCSAMDVLLIMKKQRQDLERLEVEVDGERADAVPAVFTKIHLRFSGLWADRAEETAEGCGAFDRRSIARLRRCCSRRSRSRLRAWWGRADWEDRLYGSHAWCGSVDWS